MMNQTTDQGMPTSQVAGDNPIPTDNPLFADARHLIDAARQRVAGAVNAELTQLYWQVGRRINSELLQGQRAEYGKQVIAELARMLTSDFGKGWSERQLRYCLRVADIFPVPEILHTVCSQLSWSHLRLIIQIDDPLKRDFYLEICRLERWSVRQLQERIDSLLFERTAISKKPEDIRVSNLSKCYQIYDAPRDRLKQFVVPKLGRVFPPLWKVFSTPHYRVDDVHEAIEHVLAHYLPQAPILDRTDGVSVEFADWRFNLRGSNTEPLL